MGVGMGRRARRSAHILATGLCLLLGGCVGGFPAAQAQQGFSGIVRVPSSLRPPPPPDRTAPPPAADALPDTEVARGKSVRAAYLIRPTTRYGHGVLGDAVEAGGFRVVFADGRTAEFILPADSVFEDRRVRLADMDGDGRDEAIVVRSYLNRGAALAVYRLDGGKITPLAETPALGTPYRWLNPVGAADFDGDGRAEIALVTTPHIGGTLKLYRLQGGRLVEAGSRWGFSNHWIGSRELDVSAILDFNGDGIADIVLPDQTRTRLLVIAFAGGRFSVVAETTHDAAIKTKIVPRDTNGDGKTDLVYGLDAGSTVAALR